MVETARGWFGAVSAGSGPDVLLLHSLAMSGAMWDDVAAHLARRFRVWAVDARGHGSSEWDGSDFTVEDMAADLLAVCDTLDIGRAHVLGLSLGGNTAIAFAAAHPERVAGLVLADTTASYGPDRVQKWEQRAQDVLSKPREELLQFQFDRWLSPQFRSRNPSEVQRLAGIFLETDSKAHAAACRALGGFQGERSLERIEANTLVVVGSEDYATPPAMARQLADGIAASSYREIPDVRHMSLIEHPPAWDEISEHFRESGAA